MSGKQIELVARSTQSRTDEELHKQLDLIERGGRTMRCHTVPNLRPQNVADHCYGVAWLCWMLSEEAPSANLLLAAIGHDMAECVTGDIPAPSKRNLGIRGPVGAWEEAIVKEHLLPVPKLTPEEERTLKLADALELVMHCVRERSLGNRDRQLRLMFDNAVVYACEVAHTELETDVLDIIENSWYDYEG